MPHGQAPEHLEFTHGQGIQRGLALSAFGNAQRQGFGGFIG